MTTRVQHGTFRVSDLRPELDETWSWNVAVELLPEESERADEVQKGTNRRFADPISNARL